MFALKSAPAANPAQLRSNLLDQARALLAGERDATANSANLASLIFHTVPELNWAGFYWMKGGELVLGAFQGKPACVRIALGKGVCGTAAKERRTIIVPDVDAFPGHIACDSASRSEMVVPILASGHSRAGGDPGLDSRLHGNDIIVAGGNDVIVAGGNDVIVAGGNDIIIGVLDLDSPKPNRFDDADARALEALVAIFLESTDLGD